MKPFNLQLTEYGLTPEAVIAEERATIDWDNSENLDIPVRLLPVRVVDVTGRSVDTMCPACGGEIEGMSMCAPKDEYRDNGVLNVTFTYFPCRCEVRPGQGVVLRAAKPEVSP